MIKLTLAEVAQALNGRVIGKNVEFFGCGIDTRQYLQDRLYIALRGTRFDGHDFVNQAEKKGAVAVMLEKSMNCALPILQVDDTRKALGELASFWRQRFSKLSLVAITGSNGKTTVKEMLNAIFSQQFPMHPLCKQEALSVLATEGNFNNDIGMPLTLFKLGVQHHYAVIEMGANHRGEIGYLSRIAQPTVAGITLCAPAHLEGFETLENVAKTKGEIFSGLKSGGTALINHDDAFADLWRKMADSYNIMSFALDNTADVTAKDLQLKPEKSDFILCTPEGEIAIHLPLAGRHNVLNALIASAAALQCGSTLGEIQRGLANLSPVKGRLQVRKGIHQSTLLDDTYNANPASLQAALAVLKNYPAPRWLILGDMKELGEKSVIFHQDAAKFAKTMDVNTLWAMGEMTQQTVASFGQNARHFENHTALIAALRAELPEKSTVLIKGSRSMAMEKIVNAVKI